MEKLISIVKSWLPKAVMISLVSCMIYFVAQQVYRQSADDPQYQIAIDVADAIDKGADPKSLVGAGKIELSRSLSPYFIVYDTAGNLVATNAELYGHAPKVPKGIIDDVGRGHAVTWQPEPGLREATVVEPATANLVVVAGRSLRKTEERIAMLGLQVAFGWLVSLLVLFMVSVFQHWGVKKAG